jgi:hypothetical protein
MDTLASFETLRRSACRPSTKTRRYSYEVVANRGKTSAENLKVG